MRRWVIACFTLLTLALCVPALILWVQSSFHPVVFKLPPGRLDSSVIRIEDGVLQFRGNHGFFFGCDGEYYLWQPLLATALLWVSPWMYRNLRSKGGVLAIVLFANAAGCGMGNDFAVPFVVVLDGLFFVLILRDLLTPPKKVQPGICAFCGYDLRATPERCPECGRVVEKASALEASSLWPPA